MQKYRMWIGGKWVEAKNGRYFMAYNPATEEAIAEIPMGGQEDADAAVEAAAAAFPIWSAMAVTERCGLVKKIAEEIRQNAPELARLNILDHGTPSRMAGFMVLGSAAHLDFAAEAARTLVSDMIPSGNSRLTYIQREPIGVCALITPWNAPLMMICDKIGAALATGNTCVVKPPSIDSTEALKLAEIIEKVGLPPGTVNIITGPGGIVGEALSTHPKVNMIAFTGSCATGQEIMSKASRTVKRLGMELGGKNPFIVCADADIDGAALKAAMTQTVNSGMICASPGRIYVHESIHATFVEKVVRAMQQMTVGDPLSENTAMGPVVSAEHRDKVYRYIQSAIDEGATLEFGGKRPEPPLNKGYYVMPTVFSNVKPNMTVYREEIFGPVACICDFSSEEEVIKAANDNTFGLCASVWTRDTARGIKMANQLRAGTVYVNDHMGASVELPWGGFKESGYGKVTGIMGVEEFTQCKLVWVDLNNGKAMPMPGRPAR